MSNKISNTTSLTFEYGDKKSSSQIFMSATATMNESINISATSLEQNYYLNEPITYIITINNNNKSKIDNSKITNNLGSYKKENLEKNEPITPLDYIGPSYLYINGIFKNQIEPEIKNDKIIFKPSVIPEKSTALIIYKTMVNSFSPLTLNSKIKTKTYLELSDPKNIFEVFHSIPVAEKANLKICKNITPQVFSHGESVSYNITLYNYGNTTAENIKITDTFNPTPTLTKVTINGKEICSTDYSYMNGVFNIPSYGSPININVPSAKFETDSTSCLTSVLPGIGNIVITGTI